MIKEKITTVRAPQAIGPYSQAIKSNGFLFCSGQIPIDPATGKLVEGGITEQTHQALKNLFALLEAAGLTSDHLVKTTILLSDLKNFSTVNEIYASYLRDPFPARATYQVAGLPLGAMIEIEAIATQA